MTGPTTKTDPPLRWPAEKPVPIGYWTSTEVLSRVVETLWGERCQLGPETLFRHSAGWSTRLGEPEQHGQIREACNLLWQTLCAGQLEARYEEATGQIRRIPPDNWACYPKKHIETTFVLGRARHADDNAMAAVQGALLLFDVEAAQQWTEGLQAVHCIPHPLVRNVDALPRRKTVTLCQAISWLADEIPLTIEELARTTREKADQLENYLTDDFEWQEGPRTKAEFEDFVARELARVVRVRASIAALAQTIAEGQIRSYGVNDASRKSAASVVEPIGSDGNMHLLELRPDMDRIDLSPASASNADVRRWRNVVIDRETLALLWGCAGMEPAFADDKPKAKSRGKPGAKPKYDWLGAKAEFDRLMDEHGAPMNGDPEWDSQASAEREIQNWFASRGQKTPSESSTRKYVAKWLKES